MIVACPGCKAQLQVDASHLAAAQRASGLIRCSQCGLGGRLGHLGPLCRGPDAVAPPRPSVATRTVAFACECGYYTDLPESFRHRLGRCPACHDWVLAGAAGESPPLLLMALQQVRQAQAAVMDAPHPVLLPSPLPQTPPAARIAADRRLAPRIPAVQLTAQLPQAGWRLPVANLSATGIALHAPPLGLSAARPVLLTLQDRGTPVLPQLRSRLVRLGEREAGLIFESLTMAQRRVLRQLLASAAMRANAVESGSPAPPALPVLSVRPDRPRRSARQDRQATVLVA